VELGDDPEKVQVLEDVGRDPLVVLPAGLSGQSWVKVSIPVISSP
jgi:hypothetical protein